MRGTRLLCVIGTLLLAPLAYAGVITNLGNLSNDPNAGPNDITVPFDINDTGVIVGSSHWPAAGSGFNDLNYGAFRYTSGSGIELINTITTPLPSIAYGINQGGMIAGTHSASAFRYSGAGPKQSLPFVRAYGINDAGTTVGTSTNSDSTAHFILYPAGGPALDLGTGGGGAGASPRAINNSNTVVGIVTSASMMTRGFVYSALNGLQLLPSTHLTALDVNDSGVIVGLSNSPTGGYRYLNGVTTPLSTFASHVVRPYAINNAGYVLGDADLDNSLAGVNFHAVLWTPGNVITDLDAWLDQTSPADGAKWTLLAADGMNASGQVIGTGMYNDGPGGLTDGQRAFVLDGSSFIPEPGSASVLLLGLFCTISRGSSNKRAIVR